MVTPGESIDLFLRIEADPVTNKDIDEVMDVLRQSVGLLRDLGAHVLLRDEIGNTNRYSLPIAPQSLATVIQGVREERAQIQAVYDKIAGWAACLFKDPTLGGVRCVAVGTSSDEAVEAARERLDLNTGQEVMNGHSVVQFGSANHVQHLKGFYGAVDATAILLTNTA